MKRMSLLLLSLLLLCGCGKSAPAPETPAEPARSDALPEVYSQDEYMLYQNVFYGDYGAEAVGKPVEKQGAYATVYDAYNQRQRYYVWGYYDRTKCCDWQWEFVPENPDALPAPGSMIRVTGTFAASEDALDGYWIEPADCSVEGIYTGPAADLNMAVMSCTLERVQMLNILYKPEEFEGRSFTAYGRLTAEGTLQDPYYDGSWQIPCRQDGDAPDPERLYLLNGTVEDGALKAQSMENLE